MPKLAPFQAFLILLIGSGAALSYVVVCSLLVQIGLRPGVTSVVGYILVMVPAYLGQKHLAFRSTEKHRVDFPKYISLQLVGNVASYFLSEMLARHGWQAWAIYTLLAVLIGATNFVVMRLWVFGRARRS